MNKKQLINALDLIIGDNSGNWCGCYEGDLCDCFQEQKQEVITKIVELLKDVIKD